MKKIKIILMIMGNIFIVSCESNTYKELTVVSANPTYTANVASIMIDNCVSCHSVGGTSPALTNYAQVRAATETGNLICSIDNPSSCSVNIMPKSGRMPQATIEIIKLWKTQGFIN